ncbi:MAG: hypothetical protein IIC67_09210, partial [Thaumarchaeota archaeon]|nr:hypothetical protein [Nitrososphaerota archaeon]
MILYKLGEYEEFAEALFGQLSVEIDEENEITELAIKAKESLGDKVQFKELEDIAKEIFPVFKNKVENFLGVKVPENLQLKFLELVDLKKMKGDKVFADKETKVFVTELFQSVAKKDLKKIAELMEQNTAK